MTVFFTADTHFGHNGIIRYATRPFASIEEMDEHLVAKWNARVRPADTVFHLGDFALGTLERTREYFGRLRGQKHLILGNHDRASEMHDVGWLSVQHYLRRSVDKTTFCMFHYPMLTWERRHRNDMGKVASVNLFGHVHSTPGDPTYSWDRCQYDVGVDNNEYAPVAHEEVIAVLRAKIIG